LLRFSVLDIFSTYVEVIFKEIQRLTQEHQSCFILFYREEFPVETIAEILSISNGTVKSRLFYARKKIRQILEKNYPELVKEVCYEL